MNITLHADQPFKIVSYTKSHFKVQSPDCSFFTEDGNVIPVHKDILFQTKFMRDLFKSFDNFCYKMEIIFPSVSIEELDLMVEFRRKSFLDSQSP